MNPRIVEPPYAVYVAKEPSSYGILPGSAIVSAIPNSGETDVTVYYEGNLHGGDRTLTSFECRALHAAGRLGYAYPTIAKARLPLAALKRVARYEAGDGPHLTYVDEVPVAEYDTVFADLLLKLTRRFPSARVVTRAEARLSFERYYRGQHLHVPTWCVFDSTAITPSNPIGYRSGDSTRDAAVSAALVN